MENNKKQLTSDELLEKIFYCMERLFEENELSGALHLLTELGKALVNSDRASFWFWDKKKHEIWTMAALDISKITIPENTGLVGAAIMNNELLVINDPYNDPRFNSDVDKSSGYVTKSILTVPVTNSEGKVIGAYQAVNKLDENGMDSAFNETDIKRIKLATAFCGRTLESYLLYNESIEDQLTGLKNRRGLYIHYEKFIAPILASKKASIIICDIDHFKRVNDTWGHNAGDAVLKHVANTYLGLVGIDDGIFRWGGEEFIMLLPGKDLTQAAEFAEHCRKTIEASVCHFEDLEIKVTMSFGVSELNADLDTAENVKDADAKLYYAKENGRNRVIHTLP
ncbi:MAG: sensor domain-containing diguanylate cyclase [Lachnospiraceae bacterium]|nr:sensor domain-containing diguanylate cyclase [Lachnospiraceae bacterium]